MGLIHSCIDGGRGFTRGAIYGPLERTSTGSIQQRLRDTIAPSPCQQIYIRSEFRQKSNFGNTTSLIAWIQNFKILQIFRRSCWRLFNGFANAQFATGVFSMRDINNSEVSSNTTLTASIQKTKRRKIKGWGAAGIPYVEVLAIQTRPSHNLSERSNFAIGDRTCLFTGCVISACVIGHITALNGTLGYEDYCRSTPYHSRHMRA